MAAVSYHDTMRDLQGLSFADRGPFARAEWFMRLETSTEAPCIALAREGGEAVALPLARTGTGLESLTNWYAFTWRELATAGADRGVLLEHLARDLARRSRCVIFDKLADEDGTAARLERAFRRVGWWIEREASDSNHVLAVAGRTYAQYLAARPGPLRTTLKRKASKVEVEILTSFQLDSWRSYENVYAASWKPEEGDPALLRAFAQAEGEAGRLRLGLARHQGQVVAAQFWTVENGTAYIHKLAHLESAKPLSAGTVLTASLFEHALDRDRAALVDFGTGDDPYKRDWMEQVRPRYRLTCRRPADPRNWPAIARACLRKLVSANRAR